MLMYKRIDAHFFTDTFQAKMKCKSTHGYQYGQLFVSDKGFIFVSFMKKRSEFPLALKAFANDFMHTDDFRRLFVGFVMVDTLVAMRWLDRKWHKVVEKMLTELEDEAFGGYCSWRE